MMRGKYVFVIVTFIAYCFFFEKIDDSVSYAQNSRAIFQYSEVQSIDEENNISYNKPHFEDEFLNEFVDAYIEEDICQDFIYNIFEIDDEKINIFLNCGTPVSMIYDYVAKKEVPFSDIVTDYDDFLMKVRRLLNLKYPTFVTDDIQFEKGVYDIYDNELLAYYETREFGDVSIHVNNNEIENLMIYEMHYDDAYENEKYELDANKKAVAFTFDDGPSIYDLRIIDSLTASHAKATFYLVGNRMKSYPDSIERMIATSMEIGNHTYDHKSLTVLSDDEVKDEITKTNDIFHEMTKHNLTSLRPSYGSINKRVRLRVGMPVVLWSVDTLDWKTRNADKVCESILSTVKDGDIVLMHSIYESTADAIDKVLPELYKRGFQVVSVEELAKLKGRKLDSSSVVTNIT